MSRHDETMGVLPNPSQYYLEWNSEQKAFCYWDKEAEERKPMKLPFRFLALKFMKSVTGYDNDRKKGIFSNEVANTGTELLRVQYREKNDPGRFASPLATGLYSQIKDTVKERGGKFTSVIYAMSPRGVVVNIQLTGSQVHSFGSIEKQGNRWKKEWIEVSRFEEKEFTDEKGELKKYSVPVFELVGALSPADNGKADEAYDVVRTYFVSRQPVAAVPAQEAAQPVTNEAMPVAEWLAGSGNDDDLPF